jgi:hypothetical protein
MRGPALLSGAIKIRGRGGEVALRNVEPVVVHVVLPNVCWWLLAAQLLAVESRAGVEGSIISAVGRSKACCSSFAPPPECRWCVACGAHRVLTAVPLLAGPGPRCLA